MKKNLMKLKCIKIIFLLIVTAALSANIHAQKQDASAAVKSFYQFHFSHNDAFSEKEVLRRRRFFTPKLRRLFDDELKRQKIQSKKYPTDKPYFEGLPFQPIEFCPKDYQIEKATVSGSTADVKVNFVYGKTSCQAKDGTKIFYKFSLAKIGGEWLIDNVIFDDGCDLLAAFKEAGKIK